jgi:NAD(P)-dependent dehydrogenase (short-subunit alcohol dehydrogenase family)
VLLSKGYDVTIACRDQTRAQNAVSALKSSDPSAPISYILMDLANLQSVRDAAAAWLDSGKQIDVLLNNAGVLSCMCMCLWHSPLCSQSKQALTGSTQANIIACCTEGGKCL